MSDEQPDESQKTEEPTAKRLRDARQKGQVANSKEFSTWLLLFGLGGLLTFYAPTLMREMQLVLGAFVRMPHQINVNAQNIGAVLGDLIFDVLGVLAFPLGAFVLLAFAGTAVQTGLLVTPEPMKPKPNKISLIKGVQRLFSAKQLVEFAKGIFKIALIGTVGVMVLLPELQRLDVLPTLAVDEMMEEILALVLELLAAVLAIMLVIAVLDIFFQRYQHRKQLRMTKQEVKEEFKNTEGDPQVKAKLRQIRNERARQRMMQAVPEADVVVTNPTHFAVALQYVPEEMDAPKLVAKGQDVLARRMREIAEEEDVPVVENAALARALYAAVEVDDFVPPEHYEAVAKIISYVFELKGRRMPA